MRQAVRVLLVRGQPTDEPGASPASRRATWAFALYALGEASALALWRGGHAIPASAWYGLALFAIAGAVVARRARPGVLALALACSLLAGGRFTARILEPAPRGLEGMIGQASDAGVIVTLEGIVLEQSRTQPSTGVLARFLPKQASATMLLRVKQVETEAGFQQTTGRVRLFIRGGLAEARPGDSVRVTGIAHQIDGPSNPGETDARLWARQDRLACTLDIASPDLIVGVPPPAGVLGRVEPTLIRARGRLRARAASVLGLDNPAQDRPGRAMLAALLLGESDRGELRSVFARQGLAHVLAISGFHLAVMAAAALFAVRLTGERGRLEPCLVAMLVVVYVVILPARAPVLRAAAMVLAFLGAESTGRRYDRRSLLAWVAIGLLVVRPMDLFSLGFQLTFGITGVLVWFGSRVHGRIFPPALTFVRHEPPDLLERRWWVDRTTRLASASLLCWLAASPLIARSTGVVSPTALLSTLVVIPIVTVLLWAGYAALLIGMLAPPAADPAARVLDGLSWVLLRVVEIFDATPGTTFYAPRISGALVIALTALALWWLLRPRARCPGTWAATLLALGWLAGEVATSARPRYDASLRVDMLDVGDGTCHLVRSGSDSLLWDCGSLNPSIGVRTIPRALRALGVWHVRDAVVTHPNFDHFCALPDIAEQFGLRRVFVSQAFLDRAEAEPRGATAHAVAALTALGVRIQALSAGDEISLGTTRLQILSPPVGAAFPADNDHSLVAMAHVPVRGGERRVIFCGDIQREAMAGLTAPGADVAADVLEIPHHGSAQTATVGFIEAVHPSVVLQSTGPSRAFDGRWNEARAGREWWTTATDGAAWVEIGRDGRVDSGSVRRRHPGR
ncbi:MAG: ComEC/Rec2 family competence protein [Phycisphaerales bacterium]|nr:ComEC/Rec2 family competence protein [Phycisphaerales bacterium]